MASIKDPLKTLACSIHTSLHDFLVQCKCVNHVLLQYLKDVKALDGYTGGTNLLGVRVGAVGRAEDIRPSEMDTHQGRLDDSTVVESDDDDDEEEVAQTGGYWISFWRWQLHSVVSIVSLVSYVPWKGSICINTSMVHLNCSFFSFFLPTHHTGIEVVLHIPSFIPEVIPLLVFLCIYASWIKKRIADLDSST